MNTIYLAIALAAAVVIASYVTYLILRNKSISKIEYDRQIEKMNLMTTELGVEKERVRSLSENISSKDIELKTETQKNIDLTKLLATRTSEQTSVKGQLGDARSELFEAKMSFNTLQGDFQKLDREFATANANLFAANSLNKAYTDEIGQLKAQVKTKSDEANEANREVVELTANNMSLLEKLNSQKSEIEEIKKQFNLEFENIANRILDEKTEKFTKANQENLNVILKPLGENLDSFKKRVEEVYEKESKERFSLGKEVEKLVMLNQKISEEANNLTNALKGSSKAQGDWGQMILENILEKSGLVKDREYFVQEFLKDDDGNYLKNEDGSRMQPDVIISYPDSRKVIVDSKVSLTAYSRFASTDETDEQRKALDEHLKSLKKHIEDLSRKNYQDFAPTLDFVMMFVPNEPAYLLALKNDPELWHFAYAKRILLISPTNLIAALKMMVDLWKREYQNRNAQEIAKRGAALYDKFVNFVGSLNDVGSNLNKAQKSYDIAFGQLKDGQGNLIWQAEKLKYLGIESKKTLPPSLLTGLPEEDPTESHE